MTQNISKNRRPSIVLLAALTGLTALSIDMNLPAMPKLQEVFGAAASTAQLTLSLFLTGFAGGQLVCGALSDRFGRRPVLLGGLVVFAAAGLVCALSPSLPLLIAGRFVQGFGASVGPIIARAVVRDCFDNREASSVLSRITQVMILAPLVAPLAGGYLLVRAGWASIFVVLGAAGVLLLLVSALRLPETRRKDDDEHRANVSLKRSLRTILAHRASLRHTLTVAFSYGGMFAYIGGSSFVLIEVFGIAEQNFGYFFGLTALAVMLGASANRYFLPRSSPTALLRAGVRLLTAAGLLLAALVASGTGGLAGLMVPMFFYMFGLGLVQPNATSAAMAPHGRLAGLSSSLIGCLQTAAGALTGFCVAAFYNRTPLSLAVTVAVMAVLTFLIYDRGAIEDLENAPPDADIVPEIAVVTPVE
ncbi:MAG: multidrug effflux MFS transporter [Acidobacteria bacterium]|nr:multidrug effflux MFS transporter [Acidobacteriota bacterium]